jgi:hypothetical protein
MAPADNQSRLPQHVIRRNHWAQKRTCNHTRSVVMSSSAGSNGAASAAARNITGRMLPLFRTSRGLRRLSPIAAARGHRLGAGRLVSLPQQLALGGSTASRACRAARVPSAVAASASSASEKRRLSMQRLRSAWPVASSRVPSKLSCRRSERAEMAQVLGSTSHHRGGMMPSLLPDPCTAAVVAI